MQFIVKSPRSTRLLLLKVLLQRPLLLKALGVLGYIILSLSPLVVAILLFRCFTPFPLIRRLNLMLIYRLVLEKPINPYTSKSLNRPQLVRPKLANNLFIISKTRSLSLEVKYKLYSTPKCKLRLTLIIKQRRWRISLCN